MTLFLKGSYICDTQHNNILPFCCVSLCWLSSFIYSYVEYFYADYHCDKYDYAENGCAEYDSIISWGPQLSAPAIQNGHAYIKFKFKLGILNWTFTFKYGFDGIKHCYHDKTEKTMRE